MAPTPRKAKQEKKAALLRAKAPPVKQSGYVLALCYVGLPLAFAAFVLGCCGMAVLMDEAERAQWYSKTQFADTWRWLTEQNPFYTTICVNGGVVTMLFLGTKLWEHSRAVKAERLAQQRTKARKAE